LIIFAAASERKKDTLSVTVDIGERETFAASTSLFLSATLVRAEMKSKAEENFFTRNCHSRFDLLPHCWHNNHKGKWPREQAKDMQQFF
jgi:hypothetical protein